MNIVVFNVTFWLVTLTYPIRDHSQSQQLRGREELRKSTRNVIRRPHKTSLDFGSQSIVPPSLYCANFCNGIMRHLAEADWIERLDPPSHRFRIYQSMDDLSVYEPEYEPEEVVIANGKVRLQVLSVVPPPLEYMATLHADRQEISGRQVWTGSLALAHVLEQHEPAKRDLQAKRYVRWRERLFLCNAQVTVC
jgi:hypothetical protein